MNEYLRSVCVLEANVWLRRRERTFSCTAAAVSRVVATGPRLWLGSSRSRRNDKKRPNATPLRELRDRVGHADPLSHLWLNDMLLVVALVQTGKTALHLAVVCEAVPTIKWLVESIPGLT